MRTKSNRGFTLLELIVVFSVISLVSGIGMFSFVSYSRSQTLTSSTNDFVTFLYTAKSRAQSQVKPIATTCDTSSLEGYMVALCQLGAPNSCNQAEISNNIDYAMYVKCGGNNILLDGYGKNLPKGLIQFDSNGSNTTTKSVIFNPVSGVVGGPGKIRLCLNIDCTNTGKTITIDSVGNISVQ